MIAIGQSVAMIGVGAQQFDMDISVTKTMYKLVSFQIQIDKQYKKL